MLLPSQPHCFCISVYFFFLSLYLFICFRLFICLSLSHIHSLTHSLFPFFLIFKLALHIIYSVTSKNFDYPFFSLSILQLISPTLYLIIFCYCIIIYVYTFKCLLFVMYIYICIYILFS